MPLTPPPTKRRAGQPTGRAGHGDAAQLSAPAEVPRTVRRGHGRVTLQHVATAAGVTAITVSRFLREPGVVARATAERIEAAIASTGYFPNKQAGLLASGRSNIVAALLPNLANSIFAETAQGLSDTLQAAGFELLIASTGYSLEREEQQLRALLGWHPAAVVVTGRRHSSAAATLLSNAKRGGTPVIEVWDWHVPLGRHAAEPGAAKPDRFVQIGFAHDEVGRAMAEHLLAAGHRHIAYVDSGVTEDYRAHERGLAFAAAARSAGAAVSMLVAETGDPFNAGRHMLETLLRAKAGRGQPPISAAAFANDHLASGTLLEAVRRRVAVPGRLALLGFGDFAWSRQLDPALSSVALPRYEIGTEAARALLEALSGHDAPPPATLAWRLVARASTAPGVR